MKANLIYVESFMLLEVLELLWLLERLLLLLLMLVILGQVEVWVQLWGLVDRLSGKVYWWWLQLLWMWFREWYRASVKKLSRRLPIGITGLSLLLCLISNCPWWPILSWLIYKLLRFFRIQTKCVLIIFTFFKLDWLTSL